MALRCLMYVKKSNTCRSRMSLMLNVQPTPTRKGCLRLRADKWMLVALTFMYGCAALTYASDLLRMSQLAEQTTAALTGQYYSGGIVADIAFAEQYVIQGVTVRLGRVLPFRCL